MSDIKNSAVTEQRRRSISTPPSNSLSSSSQEPYSQSQPTSNSQSLQQQPPTPGTEQRINYTRPNISYYPLPFPLSYGPLPLVRQPQSQFWTPDRPHRYIVCRHCNTILLTLCNLPTTVVLKRHFQDDVPATLTQTFVSTGSNNNKYLNQADCLMWIRRSFTGLYSYIPKENDHDFSSIHLSCRSCNQYISNLLLIFNVPNPNNHQQQNSDKVGSRSNKKIKYSYVKLSFLKWSVSLSDAYGREISAAAEANGFWNTTPAPYAGRPFK